ncbi:peptidylprolyl isomerase [Echinicola shivajiensis]|uniref:peptidylprolyl isomerase n=1 Tax=Echinicola shivajiensis TaxID=1035916 RepID=UPI001BFCCF80|nr:peptidylprolyl isomerase [Echinicola shivajiensis]
MRNTVTLLCLSLLILSCSSKSTQTYPVGQVITPKGEMLFWLYEETPIHKESFIELANAHYWDSLTFNRVIKGFVIQGGCPDTPEGFGDSPYLLEPEFVDGIKHVYGAVGAGRDDNPEKLSAGCQIYIIHDKDGIERLDGNYTVFGQVFKGLDVLDAIATVKTDSTDTPFEDVNMEVNVIQMTAEELKENGYELELR